MFEVIETKKPMNRLKIVKNDSNDSNEQTWYEGVITPISWDQKGYPIKFSLYIDELEELVLTASERNFPIHRYINKEVVVVGEKIDDETLYYTNIQIKKVKSHRNAIKKKEHMDIEEFHLHIPHFFKYGLLN